MTISCGAEVKIGYAINAQAWLAFFPPHVMHPT